MVAASCDMAAKEAYKTASIAYKLLAKLPTSPSNVHEETLKEDLILLCNQSSNRCPVFSAAGFFNVDLTMLSSIVASVTTYFIVIIQFIK